MSSCLMLLENDTKLCRICFDNDNPNDIISPCLCKGGSAYVHRKCLDNWRSLNKDGRAFHFCDVCQFEYLLEPVVNDPSADRKRLLIFRLLVARDIILIILFLQAIIIGITFFLKLADNGSNNIKNLYPTSMNSFGIYYLSSLILFLAFIGLFGSIAFCCGYLNNDDDCNNYTRVNNHDTASNRRRINNHDTDRNRRWVNSYDRGNNCDCTCYSCCSCSDCNCSGGDDECKGSCIGILVVIIVIFAIIGVFVGIILSGIVIKKIVKRHKNKLWLKQETKKYIVKDLQGSNQVRIL